MSKIGDAYIEGETVKKDTATTNKKEESKTVTDTKTATSTQGDGKVQVGDKVTFDSGKYYAVSDGSGASGSKNLSKKVYVTKVNNGSAYPYHISTGKEFGDGNLGWVKKKQIKGYRQGGEVNETGIVMLHGTKSEPEYVLNAKQTSAFTKFNPIFDKIIDKLPDLDGIVDVWSGMKQMTAKLNASAIESVQSTQNISIDRMINIEGNADPIVINDLKQIAGSVRDELTDITSNYTVGKINNNIRTKGFNR